MNIRIFRQPTKSMQDNGLFYIDTLQVQHVLVPKRVGGIYPSVIESNIIEYGPWVDVEIVEAGSY